MNVIKKSILVVLTLFTLLPTVFAQKEKDHKKISIDNDITFSKSNQPLLLPGVSSRKIC